MPRVALATVLASLATAAAGVPLWAWWSDLAAPWAAHLPGLLAPVGIVAGFRLLLAPLGRAISALARSRGLEPDTTD